MGTIWFCLVAFMIVVYVLLDGFDLGAGAIHLLVAKTDEERRQVLASIGPVERCISPFPLCTRAVSVASIFL